MMDCDLDKAEFARTVVTRGRCTLVVTDQSKFGREGLVRVCGFDAIAELRLMYSLHRTLPRPSLPPVPVCCLPEL